jgi:hypothetical protein
MLHRLKAEASHNDSSRRLRLKPRPYPLKRAKGEGEAPLPRRPLTGTPPHTHQAKTLVMDLLPAVRVDRCWDAFSVDSSDIPPRGSA